MDVRKRIGLNLKRLRAKREITQEDFATDSGFETQFAPDTRNLSNDDIHPHAPP